MVGEAFMESSNALILPTASFHLLNPFSCLFSSFFPHMDVGVYGNRDEFETVSVMDMLILDLVRDPASETTTFCLVMFVVRCSREKRSKKKKKGEMRL